MPRKAAAGVAALALALAIAPDALAGRFGRSYVPGRSWQALAHSLIALLPPLTVADLGAGEGTLAQLLAGTAKKVIAIDNSPKMVEFGGALARKHGFKNLEYRLGDLENPPIADSTVDLAFFSQALPLYTRQAYP